MGVAVSPCHGTCLNDTGLCTGILSAGAFTYQITGKIGATSEEDSQAVDNTFK